MSDLYEMKYGLNWLDATDAAAVPMGDFVFNWEKAWAGLAPTAVVSAEDYAWITGHDLSAVLAHHDPQLSVLENDWDGDGVSNVDEVTLFHTDARDASAVPFAKQE